MIAPRKEPCPHCARPIGVEYVEVEPGKCQLWRWIVEVGGDRGPAPRTISDCFGHTSRRLRELQARIADLEQQAKAARTALARHHEKTGAFPRFALCIHDNLLSRCKTCSPPRDMFPDNARIE